MLAVTVEAAELPTTKARSGRSVKTGEFVFSILPKSFQRNPTLEMTFNTDVTPYGRLLRIASPESPVYYMPVEGGYHQLGFSVGGETSPPPAELERAMTRALAVNGFLTAPDHPPSLAIIYHWGSHNKPDPETARNFPELARKYRLERAMLVGGVKFVLGTSFAMEWGESGADREEKMQFLRDQANEELYYVVASAYDYAALARGERKLAWRTTMTVTSVGLAMKETLPPLIAGGAAFLGRQTVEPEIDSRRISREGRVEVGTPTVVEEKPAAASAPTKKPR